MARIVEESYIEDLIKWIKGADEHYEISISRVLTEVKEDLENMPQVVRCKDCKHALVHPFMADSQKLACTKSAVSWRAVESDHFCSYGDLFLRRKERQ